MATASPTTPSSSTPLPSEDKVIIDPQKGGQVAASEKLAVNLPKVAEGLGEIGRSVRSRPCEVRAPRFLGRNARI